MKSKAQRILRFVRSVTIAALAAVLFWSIVIVIFEERFIFFPSVYPEGAYESESRHLNPEDHWITTGDGVRLHAWMVRAENAHATLIYFHGNAGNLSHRAEILRRYRSAGFNVFIFDYRGYGKSDGSPTEQGVYEDGRAAARYVMNLSDIDTTRIVFFGSSLGGAVAIDVSLDYSPTAMVLESTFSSGKDVARAVYPFLPVRFLLRSQFDSESKIRKLHVPLLHVHGTDDSVIPYGLGRKLFEAANDPKEFFKIQGADHNDIFFVGGQAYLDRIRSFLLHHVNKPS